MHTVSVRSLCDVSLWWLLFVIQDGADHRRLCFLLLSFPEFSHYLRVSGYDGLILYFRVYVVTSCVWSTIQCQGSHSHRGSCILWHCLDLGDYPRVSRNFLINHAYRVRSFVMRCYVMMIALRRPGRCWPSEGMLSLIVCLWIQPLSQSEWIRYPYFVCISVSML